MVSSYTSGTRPGGKKPGPLPKYPVSGFIVSDELGSLGGPEALFRMCGECPANTIPHELAGCCGSLSQRPDSPQTEEQIRSIVSRFGLRSQLEQAFPATSPLWYALWAFSPVPKASFGLLRTIIATKLEEDRRDMEAGGKIDHEQLRDFARLVKAVEIAKRDDIPLHVELLPLGHTDFGIYTVFPHCPFCKATARTERWLRRYPAALEKCQVCGTGFSPAETATSKRLKWDKPKLRELLGEERFRSFACEYLITQGETREAAIAIVEATEAAEKERQQKLKMQAELQDRKRQYLEKHIYADLVPLSPPGSVLDGEGDEVEQSSWFWFTAKDLTKALRRAVVSGITVNYLVHCSSNGSLDLHQFRQIKDPIALLKEWQSEGCSEKFSAGFRVSDSLVANVQDDDLR